MNGVVYTISIISSPSIYLLILDFYTCFPRFSISFAPFSIVCLFLHITQFKFNEFAIIFIVVARFVFVWKFFTERPLPFDDVFSFWFGYFSRLISSLVCFDGFTQLIGRLVGRSAFQREICVFLFCFFLLSLEISLALFCLIFFFFLLFVHSNFEGIAIPIANQHDTR